MQSTSELCTYSQMRPQPQNVLLMVTIIVLWGRRRRRRDQSEEENEQKEDKSRTRRKTLRKRWKIKRDREKGDEGWILTSEVVKHSHNLAISTISTIFAIFAIFRMLMLLIFALRHSSDP